LQSEKSGLEIQLNESSEFIEGVQIENDTLEDENDILEFQLSNLQVQLDDANA
jgi:chaperonin cofactor prefoldin